MMIKTNKNNKRILKYLLKFKNKIIHHNSFYKLLNNIHKQISMIKIFMNYKI